MGSLDFFFFFYLYIYIYIYLRVRVLIPIVLGLLWFECGMRIEADVRGTRVIFKEFTFFGGKKWFLDKEY